MATTDAKPGFRLPWSSDRGESVAADVATVEPTPETELTGEPADPTTPAEETESPAMIDAAPAHATTEAAVDAPGATHEAPAPAPAPTAPAGRKPNKFMADLTRAMQAAAESARADTLERLAADAKSHIEAIHADSSTEATELRKKADDDVAAVREWSKQEIARIREETDERITHRKERLEKEIEEHAAAIEARIERVQQRVAGFEAEMAAFFERLLGEDDPTRFAAMAESLPEPPPFDADDAWTPAPVADAASEAAPVVEAVAEPVIEAAPEADPWGAPQPDAPAAVDPWTGTPTEGTSIGTELAATDERADLFSINTDPEADPRLSALGLSPDFAAAEAEAAAFSSEDDGSTDADVPEIADDAIAARLAGLVPDGEESADVATTRLVVTGLISVASIAGFKRHLSRAAGVTSVGVSSGPDGEFVFTVGHDATTSLRDIVPTLPGFAARVTGEGDGELTVAATDPETEH